VNEDGEAFGRPAGVAFDAAGALLVADDVGNIVWRVTPIRSFRQVPHATSATL
jgi:glucose/arabinose dehydrogenase